jgi:hypothetical protein
MKGIKREYGKDGNNGTNGKARCASPSFSACSVISVHVSVQGRPDRPNNWEAALAEAAFMTGLERNADLVVMASYAPLFGHVDAWQWSPNLIWFDNLRSFGTPSYYVMNFSIFTVSCYAAMDKPKFNTKDQGDKGSKIDWGEIPDAFDPLSP